MIAALASVLDQPDFAPGIARGMTVIDPSGRLGTPAIVIVEEARIERVVAMYAASIGFAGG